MSPEIILGGLAAAIILSLLTATAMRVSFKRRRQYVTDEQSKALPVLSNTSLQTYGLAEAWVNKPAIRALAQFLPLGIGGAIDIWLAHSWDQIQRERFNTLLQALATGAEYLTPELIQSEEFLHAFTIIAISTARTKHSEKIRHFAQLLLYAVKNYRLGDAYLEEFVKILDDLSIRELHVLRILEDFEDSTPRRRLSDGNLENDLERAVRYWNDFAKRVDSECRISENELSGFLTRLARTGLYEPITGAYTEYTGGKGTLTALYKEFTKWVQSKNLELRE